MEGDKELQNRVDKQDDHSRARELRSKRKHHLIEMNQKEHLSDPEHNVNNESADRDNILRGNDNDDEKYVQKDVVRRGPSKKNIGSNEVKFKRLRTRSNPKSFLTMLADLNDVQKSNVKEMGLGALLDLEILNLPKTLGSWLVECFDRNKCAIKMSNGEFVYIDDIDVHIALGLPLGKVSIPKLGKNENTDVVSEWMSHFPGKKTQDLRSSDISIAMLKEKGGGEFFKRCFVIIMITALIDSTGNGGLTQTHIWPWANMDSIQDYNWCGFLLDSLVDAKKAWDENKRSFFKGPLLFLTIELFMKGEKGNDLFPFFLKWSDETLKKREEEEIRAGSFGNGRVQERQSLNLALEEEAPNEPLLICNEHQLEISTTKYGIEEHIEKMKKELSKMVIDLATLAKDTPIQFLNDDRMKNMYESSLTFLGLGKEVKEGTSDDPNVIWEQSQHPFWRDPELHHSLEAVDKEIQKKNKEIYKGFPPPSFSLGLTQQWADIVIENTIEDLGPEILNSSKNEKPVMVEKEKGKGKVVVVEAESNKRALRVRQQRDTNVGDKRKSPWQDRAVKPRTRTTKMQIDVINYVVENNKSPNTIVFKHKDLVIEKSKMETFEGDSYISKDVVDIWMRILNENEILRSPESPHRLFGLTFVWEVDLVSAKQSSYEVMYETFRKKMMEVLTFKRSIDLSTVDMVLFPVLEVVSNHYFAVSFNLKKKVIEVIDHHVTKEKDFGEQYGYATQILKKMLIQFLSSKGSDMNAKEIIDVDVVKLVVPWQNPANRYDSGIYVMRHLKTYMGNGITNWSPRFKKNSGKYIIKFREAYLETIIQSNLNELRLR